jgi:hypothetical protein
METLPAKTIEFTAIEKVLIQGDLEPLTPEQRVEYAKRVSDSLGLNFLTNPFAFMRFQGKTVLYAKRDCTDQLRRIYNVSITGLEVKTLDGLYIVIASAKLPNGRTDQATAALPIGGLKGLDLANAIMKCETKAKRRVTLSICGLGMLDETEAEDVRAVEVEREETARIESEADQKRRAQREAESRLAQLQTETRAAMSNGTAFSYEPADIEDKAEKRRIHEIATAAGAVWDKDQRCYWSAKEIPALEQFIAVIPDLPATEAQDAIVQA